jgi:hypothetical protein
MFDREGILHYAAKRALSRSFAATYVLEYSLQERAEANQKSTGSFFATKASLGKVPNMTLTKNR